jgi:signal peptidase I
MARGIFEWSFNIIVLIFATSMVAQPFIIPTGSMESTLLVGDHILVDKLAYAPVGAFPLLPYAEPKHGDIIVFRFPPDIRETYVKRVIGTPGDRIRMANKQVFRNGRLLTEPYTRHISPAYIPTRDDIPEIEVPPGQYFAMGDNRDNSSDSRVWGFVPRENIIGKPLIVYWSYEAPTEDLTDYSLHHALDLAQHFFTRTRWNRTLQLVRPDTL